MSDITVTLIGGSTLTAPRETLTADVENGIAFWTEIPTSDWAKRSDAAGWMQESQRRLEFWNFVKEQL